MRTGKIKVIIDTAEHPVMQELFEKANEFLGGLLDIKRETLEVGDYLLKPEGHEPFVVTFKETNDFRQSFFSGHLMEEILAIHLAFPKSPSALIIAKDEFRNYPVPPEVHTWVSNHWRKRNFIIPTFKFNSREKAVEFMIDCAMKIDTLQTIPRQAERPEDLHQIVGLYQFYGVGMDKAKQLADKFPKPIDLFAAMSEFRDYEKAKAAWSDMGRGRLTKKAWKEGRWWYGILGETNAFRIEAFILDGVEIPKKKRVNE